MTETAHVTDEELDAACLHMLPVARRFADAVRSRDDARTRAAFADVQRVDVPLGRSPLAVLALVLADELAITQDIRVGYATRMERERCTQLAVAVVRAPAGATFEQLKRLPSRIASGERA